jgi:hypothetical protein
VHPGTMLRVSQTAAVPPPTTTPESPVAQRLRLRRWRDPRLWVGLVLVASSVLVGQRALAGADDTVGVWALARDVGAGAPLTGDALVVRQVRFSDADTLHSYLPAGQPVPPDAVVTHDLAAGELLARASISGQEAAAFELPVVVDSGGAPDDLDIGDVVDVWVGPAAGSGSHLPARQMLTGVPVVGTVRATGPFGDAATRQVLLGLDEPAAARLGPLLGEMSSGSVVLVRHGDAR